MMELHWLIECPVIKSLTKKISKRNSDIGGQRKVSQLKLFSLSIDDLFYIHRAQTGHTADVHTCSFSSMLAYNSKNGFVNLWSSVCSSRKISMNKQSDRNCSKQFIIVRLHRASYPWSNHKMLKEGGD